MNEIEVNRESIVDEGDKTSIREKLTISVLPPECLARIFLFLPIKDRIKIQRVCKRWQDVSVNYCHDVRRLSWYDLVRYDDSSMKMMDTAKFRQVLQLCGRYLRVIDFSGLIEFDNTQVLKIVKKMCPSISSLHLLYITRKDLEYLAVDFTDLTELAVGVCEGYDDLFSQYFEKNRNLRCLKLRYVDITGECLARLTGNLLSLDIEYCPELEPDLIIRALAKFHNLESFEIDSYSSLNLNLQTGRIIDSIPNKINLKNLTISGGCVPPAVNKISSLNLNNFRNLHTLSLSVVKALNDDVLMSVKENCKELKKLVISNSVNVTKVGLEHISGLPNLYYIRLFHLQELTDPDCIELLKLKHLRIDFCPKITNKFLLNVLQTSKSLRSITISECSRISVSCLETDFLKTIQTRPKDEKLQIVIRQSIQPSLTRFTF